MKKILVISFTNIKKDSRVLRQIQALSELGEVITCGYGGKPKYSSEHIQIDSTLPSLPQTPVGVVKLATKRYEVAEFAAPALKDARRKLKNLLITEDEFDLIVSNDARALPLAFCLAGDTPVWADMHEYAPHENISDWKWRLLVSDFQDYLGKKYLPKAAWVTTVAPKIGKLYEENFNVPHCAIIYNAPEYVSSLKPQETKETIKLVHSGMASPKKNLGSLIEAVSKTNNDVRLDFYLVPGRDKESYLVGLQEMAKNSDKILFRDPVKPTELPKVLNEYDAGLMLFKPLSDSYNLKYILPNKFFDCIQARIATLTGPSIEMKTIIEETGVGIVTKDFSVEALTETLDQLTHSQINKAKEQADKYAKDLSFEQGRHMIHINVERLLADT